MTDRRRISGALVALSLFAVGCGGGATVDAPVTPPAPTRGSLAMVWTSSRSDDGAALLTVNAAGGALIDSVQKGNLAAVVTAGSAPRMLVTGAIADGSVLGRIWIPDVSKASSYSVTVDQVAARATYAQRAVQGYSVTLKP